MESFLEQNGSTLFMRLEPGADLLGGILETCRMHNVHYGTIISCIGSLKRTAYVYVKTNHDNISGIAYRDPMILDKPNELISGQGTIGVCDGKPDVHLHAFMCDVEGTLIAGHMLPGCEVCATMEIAVAVATEGTIVRSIDPVMKLPLFHFARS